MGNIVYEVTNKLSGRKFIGTFQCNTANWRQEIGGFLGTQNYSFTLEYSRYPSRFDIKAITAFKVAKDGIQYADNLIRRNNAITSDSYYNTRLFGKVNDKEVKEAKEIEEPKYEYDAKIMTPNYRKTQEDWDSRSYSANSSAWLQFLRKYGSIEEYEKIKEAKILRKSKDT